MTRYIVNLPDPLLSRLNEVAETMGLSASEIVRAAIDLHLRYLTHQPTPSAETHGSMAVTPEAAPIASVVPAAPGEARSVIYSRPPETAPLRQRGPQPLSRMTDEDKAAMIERIAKGGAEKERG